MAVLSTLRQRPDPIGQPRKNARPLFGLPTLFQHEYGKDPGEFENFLAQVACYRLSGNHIAQGAGFHDTAPGSEANADDGVAHVALDQGGRKARFPGR